MNFLPGWDMPVGAIGKAPILLTKVLEVTGAVLANIPNGVIAGDLIVIGAGAQAVDDNFPDASTPTGFTLLHNVEGDVGSQAARVRIFAKIADGTEDGTEIRPFTDPDDFRCVHILVFRPSQPIASFSAFSTAGTVTSGNPAAITVGTGEDYNLALTYYQGYLVVTGGSVASRSSSPTQSGETLEDDDLMASAFRWHIFFPPDAAEAVVSDIDDTGTCTSIISVAVTVTP
jgi:hypothetical protein